MGRLFVRNSTGLVREASAVDATIFNAVISAPIGSTIAYSIFFTLVAFPGASPSGVLLITLIINIPVLIMFALLAASMPRVGGDYVWVSRVLSPPLSLISNVAMIFGGLFGAAFFAKFFSVFALGPALVALGVLANNDSFVSWGNSFQTNTTWILIASLAMVALQTLILMRGTKTTFRWQNGAFIVAMAGTLIAFVVLIVGSRHGFLAHLDSVNHKFGGGTSADIISKANAQSAHPDLGNLNATLPTLFSIQGFMMWNFWSVYMSGELKSASNRRRQLSVMFGALIWDVVLLILGTQALFRIAGYNLVYALNYNTPVLTVLILGTFLFWSLPSMIANTYMPIRSFFAWSFDRLMPEGLAKVNERTHSPVTAILTANVIIALVVIWSVYSHSFQLVLGMIVLAGALAVIIVGAAAIALPRRRPDLYQASPANVNWFGIPVLYITGGLSINAFLITIGISLKYPALVMNGNPTNIRWMPAFLAALSVMGPLLCHVPLYLRRREGVNVRFVYKELPPE